MFGLGLIEIALLIGLLVLLFGARPVGRMLDKGLRAHRSWQKAKGEVTGRLNPLSFFDRKEKKD